MKPFKFTNKTYEGVSAVCTQLEGVSYNSVTCYSTRFDFNTINHHSGTGLYFKIDLSAFEGKKDVVKSAKLCFPVNFSTNYNGHLDKTVETVNFSVHRTLSEIDVNAAPNVLQTITAPSTMPSVGGLKHEVRVGEYKTIEIDITLGIMAAFSERSNTISLVVMNDSLVNFSIPNPITYGDPFLKCEIFLDAKDEKNEYDYFDLGIAGVVGFGIGNDEIDLSIGSIPLFNNSNICLAGRHSISDGSNGLFGIKFNTSLECRINTTPSDHIVITDYLGNTKKMMKVMVSKLAEYGLSYNGSAAFVYLCPTDLSYGEFISNDYEITYKSGERITFRKSGSQYIIKQIVTKTDIILFTENNNEITVTKNDVVEVIIHTETIQNLSTFFISHTMITEIELLALKRKITFDYDDRRLKEIRYYKKDEVEEIFEYIALYERNLNASQMITRVYGSEEMTDMQILLAYDLYKLLEITRGTDSLTKKPKVSIISNVDGKKNIAEYIHQTNSKEVTITDYQNKSVQVYLNESNKIETITKDNKIVYYNNVMDKSRNINKGLLNTVNSYVSNWSWTVGNNITISTQSGDALYGATVLNVSGKGKQTLTKEINISGKKGDTFYLGFFAMRDVGGAFERGFSDIKVKVENSLETEHKKVSIHLTNEFKLYSFSFKTPFDYTKITVEIELPELEVYRCVLFGNFYFKKIKRNEYYSFNNATEVKGITIGSDKYDYVLDYKDRVEQILSSSGEVVEIIYENDKVKMIFEKTKGTWIEYFYDNEGRINRTEYTTSTGKVFKTETGYDNLGNVDVRRSLSSDEDIIESEVSYKYDKWNRCVRDINERTGILSDYTYNDLDYISEITNKVNNEVDGVIFTRDYNNYLAAATAHNQTKYVFGRNNNQQISNVNADTKIIERYVYSSNTYEEDKVISKKYGSDESSIYTFTETETNGVKSNVVQYNNQNQVKIDSIDGEITSIEDYVNSINKTISYEEDGSIKTVTTTTNNASLSKNSYYYDNLGNIQKNVLNLTYGKKAFDYDYEYETKEYTLKGYLNRISANHNVDYIKMDGKFNLAYGDESSKYNVSLVYDDELKTNVALMTTNSYIKVYKDDINKLLKDNPNHGTVFSSTKWSKLSRDLTMFAWVKVSHNGSDWVDIMSMEHPSSPDKITLSLNSNGRFKITKITNNGQVSEELLNMYSTGGWDLVGITTYLGGQTGEETYVGININGIPYDFWFEYNWPNGRYVFGNNSTVNNGSSMKVLYAGVGISGASKSMYEEGIKYINGYEAVSSTGVRYYNSSAYENMNVVTLAGSLISTDGQEPKEYSYAVDTYTNDKAAIFEYDDESRKHVYGSYSVSKKPTSKLSYELDCSIYKTFSVWIKPFSEYTTSATRTILSFKDNVSSSNLVLFIEGGEVKIKISSGVVSTNKHIDLDKWNLVSIVINNNQANIKVNESNFVPFNYQLSANTYDVCLGYDGTGDDLGYLNGQMSMFTYSVVTKSESFLDLMYERGFMVDVRTFYDLENRPCKKEINTNTRKLLTSEYRYYDDDSTKLNPYPLSEVTYSGNEIMYGYDDIGNVTHKVTINKQNQILEAYYYKYDGFNRLIKEERYGFNKIFEYSYSYTYDSNGNILSKTKVSNSENYTDTYEYVTGSDALSRIVRDSTQLYAVNYSNTSVFPTNYKGYNLVWNGRRLMSYGNYSYSYNESGIRVSKMVNGLHDIKYVLEGSRIIQSIKSFPNPNQEKIYLTYNYDESGLLVGLSYLDKEFFYERDILGNINKILDSNGKVMVEYRYTGYGEVTKSINSYLIGSDIAAATTILDNNIFLYKGYVYDEESNLYYCESRYYDPSVGRWISIDDISYLDPNTINGTNLYAYCVNNPVMYLDSDGTAPKWVQVLGWVGLAVGVILVAAAITVLTMGVGTTIMATTMAGAVIHGAAVGALIGAGVGIVAGGIIGGAVTDWSAEGILIGMGIGFGAGALIGAIIGGATGAIQYTHAVSQWGSTATRTAQENMVKHFNKHVIEEGHKQLGKNVIRYTRNAKKFFDANQSVMKLTKTGNYVIRATFAGQNAGGFFSEIGVIFSFFI